MAGVCQGGSHSLLSRFHFNSKHRTTIGKNVSQLSLPPQVWTDTRKIYILVIGSNFRDAILVRISIPTPLLPPVLQTPTYSYHMSSITERTLKWTRGGLVILIQSGDDKKTISYFASVLCWDVINPLHKWPEECGYWLDSDAAEIWLFYVFIVIIVLTAGNSGDGYCWFVVVIRQIFLTGLKSPCPKPQIVFSQRLSLFEMVRMTTIW